MRRKLLSMTVIACLSVPVVVGVQRWRETSRCERALAEGVALLDASLTRAPELLDLDLIAARTRFETARRSSPNATLTLRARALEQSADALGAAGRGEFATASQAADGALRFDAREAHALLALAVSSHARGNRARATSAFEQLSQLRDLSAPLRARVTLAHASMLLDEGRTHEALAELETLDREQPNIGAVLNLLGLARDAAGDQHGALNALRASTEHHIHAEIPLLNLARVQRALGHLAEARVNLERALGLSQDYADAWVAYGVVLADLRTTNARHVLVRAARLAPEDATPLAAQGALDLADNDYERAVESFREALRRDPHHATARSNMGIALARLGRNAQAAEAFEQATRDAPHMGEAWNGLGAMRLAAGDAAGAVGALQQASTLLQSDVHPALNLGLALERLQQWDAAGRAYHEALRRSPGHPTAVQHLLAITPPEDRARELRNLGITVPAQTNARRAATERSHRG